MQKAGPFCMGSENLFVVTGTRICGFSFTLDYGCYMKSSWCFKDCLHSPLVTNTVTKTAKQYVWFGG